MSQIPVSLAVISIIFLWVVIAKKLGWISTISDRFKINDQFGILTPVVLSLTVPFLVASLSNLIILNFDKIYAFNLLVPSATICAASLAAFMAYKTIENSRKNERIKNTILALNNQLFQSENLTKFKSACNILDGKVEAEGSFKALCRIPSRAREFAEQFRKTNLKEYETIRDVIGYANNLCYGIKSGIYDKEMINKFLGNVIFDAWWAAMIIIRDEEFSYYLEVNKNYRRKPDFGPPYSYLYNWIDDISRQQDLKQVRFVLGRLKGGIEILPPLDSDWW